MPRSKEDSMHSVRTRRLSVSTLLSLAFALAAGPALAQAPIRAADPAADQAIEVLRSATSASGTLGGGNIKVK